MLRAAIITAIGAALLAGCGGDGGGGGGDRLTQGELSERASAICTEVNREIDALGDPQTMDELADATEGAKEIFDDGRAEMGELEPPEENEEDFDEFLEIAGRQSDRLGDLAEAARDGDEERVTEIAEEAEEDDTRADELARSFGAEECTED